jgi:hypothetical protein
LARWARAAVVGRSISSTPRSKFGPAWRMAPRRTLLARPFLPLRNLELAVKRQFRLPGAVAACACMAARALSSGFSSVGRPRAKGAMRWPRTENRSALEHLTPSKCRRATGTTLNAEYLSVGLQVCCIVRCSSRCCCCPCFAAHTTHPRVTATAHDLRPPFTPSRVCRRAQISQLQSRSSWIERRGADAAGGDESGCCRGWRGRASGRAGAAPSPASRVLRCAQMRPRRWAGSPRGAGLF